jgi:hypothetical protein
MLSIGELFIIGTLVFLFGCGILTLILVSVLRNTSPISEINQRTSVIEQLLRTLANNVQITNMENSFNEILEEQQEKQPSMPKTMFRSTDGKYTADSMEKLLMMMANDPGSGIDPNDIEALKRLFEQISKEVDDDDEDDSMDNK